MEVADLLLLPGSLNTRYICLWMLAWFFTGLYCYCNYVLVDATYVFTDLLYNFSYVSSDTTSNYVTIQADLFREAFFKNAVYVSFLLTFTSIIYSGMVSTSHQIAEVNRQHITVDVLEKYMFKNTFYAVSSTVANTATELDNMDSRFVEDTQKFGWHIMNAMFGNIMYTGIMPSIGQAISFSYLLGVAGGPEGVLISYISFIVFVGSNSLVSGWVAKSKYASDTLVNDYRKAHGNLARHAETVAFYRGGPNEKEKLYQLFRTSQSGTQTFYKRLGILNALTNWYYWFSNILNYALPGLLLLWKEPYPTPKMVASLIALTTYNYYLQSTLIYVIYASEDITQAISYGTRVREAMNYVNKMYAEAVEFDRNSKYEDSDHVEVHKVLCQTPAKQVLVNDLNFKCGPKDCLLIRGPSGTGKSSILRIICGLWPAPQGRILCQQKQTFFMPQKPYLTNGSLREQFFYPDPPESSTMTDSMLDDLLKKVNMDYILQRFDPDSVQDWANVLSGGEQQRIGMARLLYHKPSFAVLDECTSAVDSALEAKFYSQIKALGIVFVSVAHRTTVIQYHETCLTLDGKRGYSFDRVTQEMIDKAQNTDHGSQKEQEPTNN
jgi:ABC-type uncharacterized transport system fused permease/ATPase subunit